MSHVGPRCVAHVTYKYIFIKVVSISKINYFTAIVSFTKYRYSNCTNGVVITNRITWYRVIYNIIGIRSILWSINDLDLAVTLVGSVIICTRFTVFNMCISLCEKTELISSGFNILLFISPWRSNSLHSSYTLSRLSLNISSHEDFESGGLYKKQTRRFFKPEKNNSSQMSSRSVSQSDRLLY